MKKSKKTYLVNEEDVGTIDYNEMQDDLFKGESIIEAANKVFDFEEFKRQQADALKYEELQKDLFEGESILAAANKVLDFDKFKKQQEDTIQKYNDQLINDTETINYVDDFDLDGVKENKNVKISAKKISDIYGKLRKRKAATSAPELQKIAEAFVLPEKKNKRQIDQAALLAAKNISKKYKNIRRNR